MKRWTNILAALLLAGGAQNCRSTPSPDAGHSATANAGAPSTAASSFFGDDSMSGQSCSGPSADAGADPSDLPDPFCAGTTPAVSFASDVAPLVGCTGEICHPRWTYDSLVLRASNTCCDHRLLVDPGRPSQSHLVQALLGTSPCVPRMPLDGRLSDAQIATVVAWICQGAANN